jgi:hypothetical protein
MQTTPEMPYTGWFRGIFVPDTALVLCKTRVAQGEQADAGKTDPCHKKTSGINA